MVVEELNLGALLADGLFTDGDWIESKDQDPSGDVRLIQLADIGDGVFRNRSSRFLRMDKAKALDCTFLERGDVLVARMPEPLGRACVFPGVGQPAVTAVDVCILRPNPHRAQSDWLAWTINSPQFRSSMEVFIRGTTRQRISRRNLGVLTLKVPPMKDQTAVAEALDHLQAKRESAIGHIGFATTVIGAARRAVLSAAIHGELTADYRRPVRLGDGDLPAGWTRQILDDLGTWSTGGTPSRRNHRNFGGDVPWVKSGDLRDGPVLRTDEHITRDALLNSAAKLLPPGTVSVALYGATIGRTGILEIEAATNQACANCVVNPNIADRWFLFYFLLSQRAELVAAGQGGAQPNLTNRIVRDWPVLLPPVAEQREIVRALRELLETVEGLFTRLTSAEELVEHTYHALLAKAFEGDLLQAGGPG